MAQPGRFQQENLKSFIVRRKNMALLSHFPLFTKALEIHLPKVSPVE